MKVSEAIFPLFLVPFEYWHKNVQNIPIAALNMPPNSFYGQNHTAKRDSKGTRTDGKYCLTNLQKGQKP